MIDQGISAPRILIGEAGGHTFVVRNGHRQPIPWSAW
jgi:hypothetical protein